MAADAADHELIRLDEPGLELGIDYTTEELAVIAHLLDLEEFPGVDTSVLDDLAPEAREAVREHAGRTLVAHGILRFVGDDGAIDIADPHSALVGLACASELKVVAERDTPEAFEGRSWYSEPEVSVAHYSPLPDIHRLAFFDTPLLLGHILDFVELDETRPVPEAEPLRIHASELAPNAPGNGAGGPLANVLAARQAANMVRCLRREGQQLVGGEVAWIDAGDQGMWAMEPVEDGSEDELDVFPVSATWIVDRLLEYLPGGEDAEPADDHSAPAT